MLVECLLNVVECFSNVIECCRMFVECCRMLVKCLLNVVKCCWMLSNVVDNRSKFIGFTVTGQHCSLHTGVMHSGLVHTLCTLHSALSKLGHTPHSGLCTPSGLWHHWATLHTGHYTLHSALWYRLCTLYSVHSGILLQRDHFPVSSARLQNMCRVQSEVCKMQSVESIPQSAECRVQSVYQCDTVQSVHSAECRMQSAVSSVYQCPVSRVQSAEPVPECQSAECSVCWVQSVECIVQSAYQCPVCRVQSIDYRVQSAECVVWSAECRWYYWH